MLQNFPRYKCNILQMFRDYNCIYTCKVVMFYKIKHIFITVCVTWKGVF